MSSGKKRPRKNLTTPSASATEGDDNDNSVQQPSDEDFGIWFIVWEKNGAYMATVTSRQGCQVVLQGRGKLRSLSAENIVVQVNGYRLKGEAGTTTHNTASHTNDGEHGNSNIQKQEEPSLSSSWVEFDSPSWSSWVTLDLPSGAVVQIQSCRSTAVASHRQQQQQQQQPSFEVYSANDPYARPTVIPPSWKQAVEAIQKDFYHRHVHQQQTLVSSARHAMFHRESLEEDEHPQELASFGSCFQIAFCGAKGVGKSTCLRYCLNQLLSSSSSHGLNVNGSSIDTVAVLDADVGQPELGPPGLLSLSLRSTPILQQPHTHFLANEVPQYIRAYFFGSTTSQTDPQRYVECIRKLLQAYHQHVDDVTKVPLLVNLDGWVKGLGIEVLQAVIQEALQQPTHVVKILGDNKSRIFELVVDPSKTTLHTCYAFNSNRSLSLSSLSPGTGDGYNGTATENTNATGKMLSRSSSLLSDATDAALLPVPAHSMSLPPGSLRSLRLLAYFLEQHSPEDETQLTIWDRVGFGQNQQEGFLDDLGCEMAHRLAAARPYVVPMEAVECVFSNAELHLDIRSEEMMWNALNGSIVGLCQSSDNGDATAATSDPSMLPCVGLGIVRAIDRVRRLFYILTPVAHSDLLSVNVLTLASNTLALPLEATFRGIYAESSPHLAFDDEKKLEILGADPIKSRNTIARRSLASSG